MLKVTSSKAESEPDEDEVIQEKCSKEEDVTTADLEKMDILRLCVQVHVD